MRKMAGKMLAVIMAVSLLLGGSPIHASTRGNRIRSGNYEYLILNEETKEATLTKVYNYSEEVVLPSQIDGYKIIKIGYYATPFEVNTIVKEENIIFSEEDTKVKKLVIPEGVREVDRGAFYVMQALKNLQLPNSLKIIGKCNFGQTANLKYIEFPDGIYVSEGCFNSAIFDKMVLKGNFTGVYDAREMGGSPKKVVVKASRKDKIGISIPGTPDVLVEKGVKSVVLGESYVNNITLKNSKTKLYIDEWSRIKGNITGTIKKVKCNKKKYRYTWSALKVKSPEQKIKKSYEVKYKKGKGKWKKISMKKNYFISSKKNLKVSVKAKYKVTELKER